MHPAYSVIFFTTASGVGYGLLALVGLGAAAGILDGGRLLGIVALCLALVLVSAGLLSSTVHLGRPERAWRAFSQWRTSWLSREGVLALATYLPATGLAAVWYLAGPGGPFFVLLALLSAAGAVATVAATAMIYASLRPVPQWSAPFTLPAYLMFAVMSGSTLLAALLAVFGANDWAMPVLASILAVAGWALKRHVWNRNDTLAMPVDTASATGLTGRVRSVEWPHTEANFVLREMGFQVARKHALRLRAIAQLLAFALPVLLLIAAIFMPPALAAIVLMLAVCVQLPGLLVERWLFFAEAQHVASLYYVEPRQSGIEAGHAAQK